MLLGVAPLNDVTNPDSLGGAFFHQEQKREGRIIRLVYFSALFIFLLLPAAVASAIEKSPWEQDFRHGSFVGEWRPGEDTDQPALSINEPMYFVVGRDDGETRARFQFSFKYRIFDADGIVVRHASWLEKLHFGYTQKSLWNLSADSKPFEDSSYRPSLFWEFQKNRGGALPDFLRAGYEHESNGQGGMDSRSIDTLFVLPAWETQIWERNLVVGPKLYVYLDQEEENRDIEGYRGYADLIIRYGNEDGWLLASLWRHGERNKNTVQLDLSYPIRKKFLARAGGYFYVQAFHGYGESLLAYDQNQDLRIRLGFAIVR